MELENKGDRRALVVENSKEAGKASGQQLGTLLEMATRGIEALKEKLIGRKVWRSSEDGKLRIKEKEVPRSGEEEDIQLEELVEEGEEVCVECEEVEKEGKKCEEGSSHSGLGIRSSVF